MLHVRKATPLQEAREPKEDGGLIRQLVQGEIVEHVDGPEDVAGAMRMRVRSERDGTVGWVTVRDAEGKASLTC